MNINKNIPHVVVDIEANGGIIGKHSMISFGACIVELGFKRTFYREVKPISDEYIPEALAVSGFTHEQCKSFGLLGKFDFDIDLRKELLNFYYD